MNINVALVEDEFQIRESLALLIDGSEGFSCVHTYDNAESAIASIPSIDCNVVLMDINLGSKSGIDCIEILKPKCPHIQFLMCTAFEDNISIFKALKAGASGYLIKTTPPAKILESIIDVTNGGSPMSSQIARKVVESFSHITQNTNELHKLTTREIEILNLLARGLRYKEIAVILFISVETVRTHIRNIYEKLQVNSRTEALNKIFPV